MRSGLVNVTFSLPEWQAVKMIFFAPCEQLAPISKAGLHDQYPSVCAIKNQWKVYVHITQIIYVRTRMTQNNGVKQVYWLLVYLNKTWLRWGTFHEQKFKLRPTQNIQKGWINSSRTKSKQKKCLIWSNSWQIHYNNNTSGLASKSKPLQNRSKDKIPGWARCVCEWPSCFKSKKAFLVDSYLDLSRYL